MGNYNRDDRSGSRRNSGRGDYGGGNFGGDRGRREMHKAICDKCGKECEVPFKPTGGKPVYCSDCFDKTSDRGGSSSRRPDYVKRDRPAPQNNVQLETIIIKLDKILEVLSAQAQVETPKQSTEQTPIEEDTPVEKKKKKAPKKKSLRK